jgi:hypothetical protein
LVSRIARSLAPSCVAHYAYSSPLLFCGCPIAARSTGRIRSKSRPIFIQDFFGAMIEFAAMESRRLSQTQWVVVPMILALPEDISFRRQGGGISCLRPRGPAESFSVRQPLTAWLGGRPTESFDWTVKHFPHLDHLSDEGVGIGGRDCSDVSRSYHVILQSLN